MEEKYQIRNLRGNVLDHDLTYEEALLWVDCSVGKYYIMEKMKGNQNDSDSL